MNTESKIDILRLNALGPYNHGTWIGQGKSLGKEEALEGRAMHIVEQFVSCIESTYTREELAEMTLVDIGCYDGFLSVEIEKRVKFKKITGIEPREKNIQKGIIAREYCGIKTDVEFKIGDIESLPKSEETYDIVFCSGVFHHLENIDKAIKLLKSICKKSIFIESQVYFSPRESRGVFKRTYDNFNLNIIEPKDVIYKFIPKSYSVSGFKFETNYYDGSASDFSLVTVPSPETIKMTLEANGFSKVNILSMGADYRNYIKSNLRTFSAACLFAINSDDQEGVLDKISDYVYNYEKAMLFQSLEEYISCVFLRSYYRRQATGDRRQATGDRRQATGDRRQATGDRRQATGDRAC